LQASRHRRRCAPGAWSGSPLLAVPYHLATLPRLLLPVAPGAGWTSLPLLPLLHRPTLLLAGADDPLIPLINGHIMHRLIPGSELVVYPGGHLDLVAEPHRLAPVIERFLRAPGPADPALAGRKAVS
jgi:pimeloyl-ACP methyl ester carboxylesterase